MATLDEIRAVQKRLTWATEDYRYHSTRRSECEHGDCSTGFHSGEAAYHERKMRELEQQVQQMLAATPRLANPKEDPIADGFETVGAYAGEVE